MIKRRKLKYKIPFDYQEIKLPHGCMKWTDEQWAKWEKSRDFERRLRQRETHTYNDGSNHYRHLPVRYDDDSRDDE